jgi:hypothetical protein
MHDDAPSTAFSRRSHTRTTPTSPLSFVQLPPMTTLCPSLRHCCSICPQLPGLCQPCFRLAFDSPPVSTPLSFIPLHLPSLPSDQDIHAPSVSDNMPLPLLILDDTRLHLPCHPSCCQILYVSPCLCPLLSTSRLCLPCSPLQEVFVFALAPQVLAANTADA